MGAGTPLVVERLSERQPARVTKTEERWKAVEGGG